jgi:hypothetical protein
MSYPSDDNNHTSMHDNSGDQLPIAQACINLSLAVEKAWDCTASLTNGLLPIHVTFSAPSLHISA